MRFAILAGALLLGGCAYNVTMMPRDSGKVYTGEFQNQGGGTGTMSVNMENATCTGPVVRVGSNETFGFANTFGNAGRTQFSSFSTVAMAGDVFLKAVLSCTDGSGLRCDFSGRGASGGGICMDDKGRVLDAVAVRR